MRGDFRSVQLAAVHSLNSADGEAAPAQAGSRGSRPSAGALAVVTEQALQPWEGDSSMVSFVARLESGAAPQDVLSSDTCARICTVKNKKQVICFIKIVVFDEVCFVRK